MNRETEYYEQFGRLSCSDPEDQTSGVQGDDESMADIESDPEDHPSVSDEEPGGAKIG